MSAVEQIKETKAQRAERIKRERSPLLASTDLKEELKNGGSLSDETIERLKWYGLYLQKPSKDDSERYFMLRVKLVNGEIDAKRLAKVAEISRKFAKNTADFTTRGDIQLHFVAENSIETVLGLLNEMDIFTAMACGDCPRNIVTCPMDGVSLDSIASVSHTVKEIDALLTGSSEFENLPRKFKIGICGCANHCVKHEIQDLSFTAFELNGEVLFDIAVGGGLGSDKRFAARLNAACKQEEIADVCTAVARLFKEMGNRQDRTKARVRHILNEIGVRGFKKAIEERLHFGLTTVLKAPKLTPFKNRNHYGIHPSKQVGKSNIGCASAGGTSSGDRLFALAAILQQSGSHSIKLSGAQNFVARGVPSAVAHSVSQELAKLGYPSSPSVFTAGLTACTGLTYCRLAISETKGFASQLASELQEEFSDVKSAMTIGISGCQNGCSHPFIADISLVGTMVKMPDGRFERGFEIGFAGRLSGSRSSFAATTELKLAPEDAKKFVRHVVKRFVRSRHTSFSTFVRQKGGMLANEYENAR